MPLRYLWVFAAYIALRKAAGKFHPEYRFVKNQGIALTAGVWCFFGCSMLSPWYVSWKAIWPPQP